MKNLRKPSQPCLETLFTDITGVNHCVEFAFRKDKKVIWVNIDGICVLRVCQLERDQLRIQAL